MNYKKSRNPANNISNKTENWRSKREKKPSTLSVLSLHYLITLNNLLWAMTMSETGHKTMGISSISMGILG